MMGAVLAGGSGRRFGGNKLLVRMNEKPLILHTVERLKRAGGIDEIVLIASPNNAERLKPLGLPIVVDELMIGPIGGVYTALSLGDAFVVAGDMPLLVPEFIDYIIARFEGSGKALCVPRWDNGYLEPLHAAYSSSFRKHLRNRIESGDYALNSAIRESDACYLRVNNLPEGWREGLFNVNTREDLMGISRIF